MQAAPVENIYFTDVALPTTPVDERVQAGLATCGLTLAPPCSDAVFVRRVYLDVIGTLPTADELRAFHVSRDPHKRAALIDELLARPEFADYWSLKWCDLLRVKSEFPINLWPNAVQTYHRWIRDALRRNQPYDEFARELLTASGSNFRVAPVNFYRAVQGQEPETLAAAVALTFMGVRLEHWPAERRAELAAFFSRLAFKKTAEWKEEIVFCDPTPTGPLRAVFPDGAAVTIPADDDPRQHFADWLVDPDNPWFARAAVNRIWAWLMGRGIIHKPDDIRSDNTPVNPALLAHLEAELVRNQFDLRHVYRLILNSRTYQQSSITRNPSPAAEVYFAGYPVRRLDAEVLIDALAAIFGPGETYTSVIPEPFAYVPEHERTIALADGSITSQFLEMFGRPARDTGLFSERNNDPTDAQRLHLLNSTHIQRKIAQSWRLRQLVRSTRSDDVLIRSLYLRILSRPPTTAETDVALHYLQSADLSRADAVADLAWALINTKEFLYRH